MASDFEGPDGIPRVPSDYTDADAISAALRHVPAKLRKKYIGDIQAGDRGTLYELVYLGALWLRHGDDGIRLFPAESGPDAKLTSSPNYEVEVKAHLTTPADAKINRACQEIRSRVLARHPHATGAIKLDGIDAEDLRPARIVCIVRAISKYFKHRTTAPTDAFPGDRIADGITIRPDGDLLVYRGFHGRPASEECQEIRDKLFRHLDRKGKGPQFTGYFGGILVVLCVDTPALESQPWIRPITDELLDAFPVLTAVFYLSVPLQRPGLLCMRGEPDDAVEGSDLSVAEEADRLHGILIADIGLPDDWRAVFEQIMASIKRDEE